MCVSGGIVFCIFCRFWVSWGPFWRSFWCLGTPRSTKRSRHGAQDASRSGFGEFRRHSGEKRSPLLEHFFDFLVLCSLLFCSTEKVSQKDSQKGLPGGPQEGSRLDGSSFFHFCSRTQKGLQNGSQNGAFWEPRSPLYYFLEGFSRADF